MNNFEKVFSDKGNKQVVLINRLSDPSMWVLYVYKKILFFKKKMQTYWFTNQKDAEVFALEYVKNNLQ
ncbi:MAG TPA: hypothetical protein PKC91_07360 [Ignavibacteria bacterium]|nr:hypothetical protein [Ignavibacteria bacterium]